MNLKTVLLTNSAVSHEVISNFFLVMSIKIT